MDSQIAPPYAVVFYSTSCTFLITAEEVTLESDTPSIDGQFFDLVNAMRGLLADYTADVEPTVAGFSLPEKEST